MPSPPSAAHPPVSPFTENIVKTLVGKGPAETSYANWNKDLKHRQLAKKLGIMEEIWPENNGPLPWRLTRQQLKLLDKRVGTIKWPHYMERLFYKGDMSANPITNAVHILSLSLLPLTLTHYCRSLILDETKPNVEGS